MIEERQDHLPGVSLDHPGHMKTRTICIVQSNYIPWRGYFDLIRRCDEVILFDSVQYTIRDWRNRNQIKTRAGLQWVVIPVSHSGALTDGQRIDETKISDSRWARKHLASFEHAYGKAPQFDWVIDWLRPLYERLGAEPLLTTVNEQILRTLAQRLGIRTNFARDTDYLDHGALATLQKSDRLLALCKAAGATHYLSGPAARNYLDVALMNDGGVEVEWMDYAGYPNYPQLWGEFVPNISVLDLLFAMGSDAPGYVGTQPLRASS